MEVHSERSYFHSIDSFSVHHHRSLFDSDFTTTENDLRPSASCSARESPRCSPANTPPDFPGLGPRIWRYFLRLGKNGNVREFPNEPLAHEMTVHITRGKELYYEQYRSSIGT
jgi:hypothetical protein